ncbi:MAG: glycerophosphodiester phosphodiesterase family protein [Salinibacter sp.]|uniref:glycerophosphodiester phosphodiesterase family protein n=1 Tax=Salinibacter sp. TaxID=2065818 RepID=UPI002FC38DFC
MSLPLRSASLKVVALLLLVSTGGLLFGCAPDQEGQARGQLPAPAPSNYRDFESADSLAAYLRSDALPLVGAHRGGPTREFPENAIPTFAHSLTTGPVLLETDVRMTKDSVLVLMHDEMLDRTTTGTGEVASKTLRELRNLQLVTDSVSTYYRIPTLVEALAWAEGRAVLQLDIKEAVPRDAVADVLRKTDALDQALVITYTPGDARWYHERLPNLLLSASMETREEAETYVDGVDPSQLVAFAGIGEPSQDVVRFLSSRDIPVAVGTFGDLDQQARREGLSVYRALLDQGIDIISTDETALASQAVATYQPETTAEATP